MSTHALPYFTRENGPLRQTWCGAWIRPSGHTNEPSCPECLAALQAEAAEEDKTAEEMFGPAPTSDPSTR